MLLRCIRRFRESFTSETDPQSLFDAEFAGRLGPELELSVYRVSDDEWLAAFMCHRAAGATDFPRFARGIDVAPVRDDAEPDELEGCPFALISSTHCVLRFDDEPALLAFVGDVVRAAADGRSRVLEATKNELRAWLRAQRKAAHSEWTQFLSVNDEWAKLSMGPDSVPPPAAP